VLADLHLFHQVAHADARHQVLPVPEGEGQLWADLQPAESPREDNIGGMSGC
jgi:hypothetical protein